MELIKITSRIDTGVLWDGDAGGWRYPLFPVKGCIMPPPVVVCLNTC